MRSTLCAAAAAVSLLLPAAAQAQSAPPGSPYYLALAQSFSHESNIYRLADDAPLGQINSRSDTVAITSLLAGLDQTYSRQRLRVDASLRSNRFSQNERLNNSGHGLKAVWDWATVNQLSGSVSGSVDKSLVRFGDDFLGSVTVPNVSTSRELAARVQLGLVSKWALASAVTHNETNYSAGAFRARDNRQNSVNVDLRYAPSPGLSGTAGLRVVEGRYPRFAQDSSGAFIEDRYSGRYADVGVVWTPSSASQLEAKLSLGRLRYDRATATDFSGLTGTLVWNWRPTGRLRVESRLARDRGQDATVLGILVTGNGVLPNGRVADFSRITNSAVLSVGYALTGKVDLTGSAFRSQRDLRDVRQDLFGNVRNLSGRDTTNQFTLAARWQATRTVVLGCSLSHEQRDSNSLLSTDLGNNTRFCYGQVSIP